MSRLTLVFVLLLFSTTGFVFSQSKSILEELRNELFYSTFNLDRGTQFYQKIIKSGETNATLNAYQAAAKALIAKYSWNPVTKVSYLKSVEELLTNAVNEEKDNLEIRFLRFYIQNSIPSYLGYSKNLKEDGDILKNNIASVEHMGLDKGISDYIVSYVSSIGMPKSKKKM